MKKTAFSTSFNGLVFLRTEILFYEKTATTLWNLCAIKKHFSWWWGKSFLRHGENNNNNFLHEFVIFNQMHEKMCFRWNCIGKLMVYPIKTLVKILFWVPKRIKRNVIIIVLLKKYSNVHIISLKMVCVQTKNIVLLFFGTP
jgi:hypothetical protein